MIYVLGFLITQTGFKAFIKLHGFLCNSVGFLKYIEECYHICFKECLCNTCVMFLGLHGRLRGGVLPFFGKGFLENIFCLFFFYFFLATDDFF